MNLKDLCVEAHRIAVAKGFYQKNREVSELLCLLHSEISEALECDRKDDRDGFREEMADLIIRTADACQFLGIDIEKEVERKMKINEKRPFKHGKRY